MCKFATDEKLTSQLPAVLLLVNMGYEFISPDDALRERQNRRSNVILEGILRTQLKKINRFQHKDQTYRFSEENIQTAIQKLKSVKYDGLLQTNEKTFNLLTLGTALEQTVNNITKSHTLHYIDWRNVHRNRFHVAVEYSVMRRNRMETARPDIVLFVNGIPFCVIECKAPDTPVDEAVSQSIRNQNDEYIPGLFVYSQMVIGMNKNCAKYATVGTSAKFWSLWRETAIEEGNAGHEKIKKLVSRQPEEQARRNIKKTLGLASDLPAGSRIVTTQDKTLYALVRPERLLQLSYNFTLFDGGIRKIARYQQYFVVQSALNRLQKKDSDGIRRGGIVWHTQGSGKSLTMVMLVRNLALRNIVRNPRIIVVTDRRDLDRQLDNTFAACGLNPHHANSGKHLLDLVSNTSAGIITTLVHKFSTALKYREFCDNSSDIFILTDESHRTQYGELAAQMRRVFPRACYIGFTGTPLMKKEKNSFRKFGGLISPHYSISQAVRDKAVVPLLYEGRHVEMEQNQRAIDIWFERHTNGLSKEQKADLKKKYARAEMLQKTEQVVYMRAFDISEHYRENWKNTGFKAQLVAPGKSTAIKYHKFLNEIGAVTSDVVISAPDDREGYEEYDKESENEVVTFWHRMMTRYGGENEYLSQVINNFKYGEEPEILIVVDKLLTGFDAPRNTVLYLCRTLKEHTLLQAIARVNRICDHKEYGQIIDYENILQELDTALTMYKALEKYDEKDLSETLISVKKETARLSAHHAALLDIFKEVATSRDEEAYERLLANEDIREMFFERLFSFAKTLKLALSSETFIEETPPDIIARYKSDLKRFVHLKRAVQIRYAQAVDYRDYEPKIQKLLDTHIQAYSVSKLNSPTNIFNEESFSKIKDEKPEYGANTAASKAERIAGAMKKTISEKMEEDPALYKKFSQLIQTVIDDFRARRISDLEYLRQISDIGTDFTRKSRKDVPGIIRENPTAAAYYGTIRTVLDNKDMPDSACDDICAVFAEKICDIFNKYVKVQFWDDEDARNRVADKIDDYMYDTIIDEKGISLSEEQMDLIIQHIFEIAKKRWNL